MLLQLLRKYTQLSDEELVEKYQSSNDIYYAALLFERYNELTVSLSISYLKNESDAEDATMECFEILVKDLKSTEVHNFGGWYYSMVRNYLLKIKRRKRRIIPDDQVASKMKHDDDSWKKLFTTSEAELENYVHDLLDHLKEDQRKCLVYFFIEERSYKEIAEIEGISEKKVKSHIQNGKRKLKTELEQRNVKSIDEI